MIEKYYKEENGEDIEILYKEMLDILRDKNKSDSILSNLQVVIKRKPIKIINIEWTEKEKNGIKELMIKNFKIKNSILAIKFHNCCNCKNRLREGDRKYHTSKPCLFFNRKLINLLYKKKYKCKFFDNIS